MFRKATMFCLLVLLWVSFGGCAGMGKIIDESALTADEIEKIKAVRLIEASELDEGSYKVIEKVEGLSCPKKNFSETYKKEPYFLATRSDAIEQLKIYAVRAGGNAITNVVCLLIKDPWTGNSCLWTPWQLGAMECEADAIQLD